jgi:hypothetical protein
MIARLNPNKAPSTMRHLPGAAAPLKLSSWLGKFPRALTAWDKAPEIQTQSGARESGRVFRVLCQSSRSDYSDILKCD